MKVRFWYWGLKAPKKNSLSFTIGPPSVTPKSVFSVRPRC